jgi:hypothetical protein
LTGRFTVEMRRCHGEAEAVAAGVHGPRLCDDGAEMTSKRIDPEDYALHALRLGLQYYTAGRYAAAAHLVPVCGNLLHHALEMLLKAAILRHSGFKGLHTGHHIPTLWRGFKREFSDADWAQFDRVINDLHKFEHLRYPDDMLREGAFIHIAFGPNNTTLTGTGGGTGSVPAYALQVDTLDRLVPEVLSRIGFNIGGLSDLKSEHADKYLRLLNRFWPPPQS